MERSGMDFPVLIAQTGAISGQKFPVETDLTIGRDESCNIIIPDRQISRFHARLVNSREGVRLEDMGSKNGTYCNGKPVDDPILLQDGDQVQVAVVFQFVFLSSDATMPMDVDHIMPESVGGLLRLDGRSRRVWIGQTEILPPISAPQFRLLQALYERQGQVVPRQDLISIAWGEEDAIGVSEQAFDALVRRLRERLQSQDPSHPYVVTIRGHGLRLDNPVR